MSIELFVPLNSVVYLCRQIEGWNVKVSSDISIADSVISEPEDIRIDSDKSNIHDENSSDECMSEEWMPEMIDDTASPQRKRLFSEMNSSSDSDMECDSDDEELSRVRRSKRRRSSSNASR